MFFSYGCEGKTALGQPAADLRTAPYGSDGKGKAPSQIPAVLEQDSSMTFKVTVFLFMMFQGIAFMNSLSCCCKPVRFSSMKSRFFFITHMQSSSIIPQTNPPLQTRSLSLLSQGSGSSPGSQHRINQNANSLLGLSQLQRSSSLYSSRKSLLPDHLLEAREVRHFVVT